MLKKILPSRIIVPAMITLLIVLCIPALSVPLFSCSPRQVLGELLVSSDVDEQTFEPIGTGSTYSIYSPQIVASIWVSGIRGNDRWRFTWKNNDTGEVIADSSSIYSEGNSAFVEGYLSNKLLPAEGSAIIAEPGAYTVSYYHNGELSVTSDFIIEKPRAEILEVGLYKALDESGDPETQSQDFFQSDSIYIALKLDYKLEGDLYSIKWFQDELLLGEEEFMVTEVSFVPGYVIFQLISEDQIPFPVGSYRVELMESGQLFGEYLFQVVPEEYTEDIFYGKQVYKNDDFGFEIQYPDNWSLSEEEIEAGIKAGFVPDDGIRQIIINMWALKKDYSPLPDDYSDFADELLAEQKGQEEGENIIKTEGKESIKDYELFEVRYDNINGEGGGWSMTFSFLKRDSLLLLFMRLTDPVYIDYGENVMYYMINSMDFNG